MNTLNFSDFLKAKENLQGIVHETNLDFSRTFSDMVNGEVYLKTENLQKTGSFKIRGAYNKIANLRARGNLSHVVAASAGNHAQGVALGATKAGITSTIVMPEGAPLTKVVATRGYGAEVILHGEVYDDAYKKAIEIQEKTGGAFIHAFDDLDVIAGQGTIGLEILDELPEVDIIVAPIGGGGLISGVAYAVKQLRPQIKVIGVEAAGAACMLASRTQGKIANLTSASTIADGIAVKCPGLINFNMIQQYVDDIVTVEDEEIASTILMLLERAKLMVEGAGATSLAAVLSGKIPCQGKKVASIISGGNIDVNFISRIIEKGLVQSGRNVRLAATLVDKPGSLHKYLEIIAKTRANVMAINHDRLNPQIPLGKALVDTVLETQSKEHIDEIINELKKNGFDAKIVML